VNGGNVLGVAKLQERITNPCGVGSEQAEVLATSQSCSSVFLGTTSRQFSAFLFELYIRLGTFLLQISHICPIGLIQFRIISWNDGPFRHLGRASTWCKALREEFEPTIPGFQWSKILRGSCIMFWDYIYIYLVILLHR